MASPAPAAGGEADDLSSASAQESQPSRAAAIARRMLVPALGRSSTLKSGSLQDLKSTQARQPGAASPGLRPASGQLLGSASGGGGSPASVEQQQPAAAQVKPKLQRQRSSQASSATRGPRNPFRSSKSMLLLAQNQHIPQASAQLDCFMRGQQVDFLNYAQLAAAAAATSPSARSFRHATSASDDPWPSLDSPGLQGHSGASLAGGQLGQRQQHHQQHHQQREQHQQEAAAQTSKYQSFQQHQPGLVVVAPGDSGPGGCNALSKSILRSTCQNQLVRGARRCAKPVGHLNLIKSLSPAAPSGRSGV